MDKREMWRGAFMFRAVEVEERRSGVGAQFRAHQQTTSRFRADTLPGNFPGASRLRTLSCGSASFLLIQCAKWKFSMKPNLLQIHNQESPCAQSLTPLESSHASHAKRGLESRRLHNQKDWNLIGLKTKKNHWMRSAEARRTLRISTCDLMHLREAGKLRFQKQGNAYLYASKDVERVTADRSRHPSTNPDLPELT